MVLPHKLDQAKYKLYPIEKQLMLLARNSKVHVIGIFDMCREILGPRAVEGFEIHTSNWLDSYETNNAEILGSYCFNFAVDKGEVMVDLDVP